MSESLSVFQMSNDAKKEYIQMNGKLDDEFVCPFIPNHCSVLKMSDEEKARFTFDQQRISPAPKQMNGMWKCYDCKKWFASERVHILAVLPRGEYFVFCKGDCRAVCSVCRDYTVKSRVRKKDGVCEICQLHPPPPPTLAPVPEPKPKPKPEPKKYKPITLAAFIRARPKTSVAAASVDLLLNDE